MSPGATRPPAAGHDTRIAIASVSGGRRVWPAWLVIVSIALVAWVSSGCTTLGREQVLRPQKQLGASSDGVTIGVRELSTTWAEDYVEVSLELVNDSADVEYALDLRHVFVQVGGPPLASTAFVPDSATDVAARKSAFVDEVNTRMRDEARLQEFHDVFAVTSWREPGGDPVSVDEAAHIDLAPGDAKRIAIRLNWIQLEVPVKRVWLLTHGAVVRSGGELAAMPPIPLTEPGTRTSYYEAPPRAELDVGIRFGGGPVFGSTALNRDDPALFGIEAFIGGGYGAFSFLAEGEIGVHASVGVSVHWDAIDEPAVLFVPTLGYAFTWLVPDDVEPVGFSLQAHHPRIGFEAIYTGPWTFFGAPHRLFGVGGFLRGGPLFLRENDVIEDEVLGEVTGGVSLRLF